MLSNILNDSELRTFIFKVLGIYSGWLASLCKIWEMSCQLFTSLLSLLENGEAVSVTSTEQLKPAEAANEVNNSIVETSVCVSKLPAGEQTTSVAAVSVAVASPEAKVETSSEHAEAAKRVEAPAETMKQVSTEAQQTAAPSDVEINEIKSIVNEPKVEETKPEVTSSPPVEETKPEVTSSPPVEETKPEGRETTSEPAEAKCETTSDPSVETHKPTEEVSTSNVEVVETTSSAGKEHDNSSPSPEGDLTESKPLDERNESNERNELINNPSEADELSTSLGTSEAKLTIKRLKRPKQTAVRERHSSERPAELSEAFEDELEAQIQSSKKSKGRRINLKRK
ncbi:MAG: hypothetical protein ACTS6G_04560 [Candidatus Hodgkinia cicadicola]